MSDDSDLRSYTRRGALGLMGAGGVLAATETLGFTQLTADRGVGVSVGSDDEAGVKIVDNSDDTKITQDSFSDPAEIKFKNNTSTDIASILCSLGVGSVAFDDGGDFTGGELDNSLNNGSSAILTINNTSNDGEDAGTSEKTTLSIEIKLDRNTDPPVRIDLDREITIDP